MLLVPWWGALLLGWLAAKTLSVVSALVEAVVVLGLRHPAILLWALTVHRGETAEVKGRNRVAQMAADQEQVMAAMGTPAIMTAALGMAAPKVTALVRIQMIVDPMQQRQRMMWMAVTVQGQLVMGGRQEELVMMMEPTH